MCETELPFLKSLNRKSPLCLLMSSSGCMPSKGGGGGGGAFFVTSFSLG